MSDTEMWRVCMYVGCGRHYFKMCGTQLLKLLINSQLYYVLFCTLDSHVLKLSQYNIWLLMILNLNTLQTKIHKRRR